ncbi:hypothetical protein GMLC_22910 [Geomonas limicola]|uniref:Motility protein n=1 Tax=Geomonas limicola TaxID=2740186 RepID=A0A6V8N807_9BACT|nr:hypothetical protein [Geomonas limicola]GFO68712.1 hypothetical protein GMLC_22910 [Geomonas limicola]
MEISAVAGATQLLQLNQSTEMMKKAADAQMQMATMVAQVAQQAKPQAGFSVYA